MSQGRSEPRPSWRRAVVVCHRWLGILVGPLVALWCVSGAVMTVVGFPELGEAERLAGLEPLRLEAATGLHTATRAALPPEATDVSLERVGGRRVLRVHAPPSLRRVVDAATGAQVESFDRDALLAVATAHQRYGGLAGDGGEARRQRWVERDQWTVSGRFDRHRPLLRVDFADESGTSLWLSSQTGEVVQEATARELFWNGPGAVTHWLYLTPLRRHPEAWSAVVVATSLLALVLLALGVWLGIEALLRGRDRRLRGAYRWHHLTGLAGSLVLLVWTLSGLLSMNPWGLLEGEGASEERQRLAWLDPFSPGAARPAPVGEAVAATLEVLAQRPRGAAEIVSIRWRPFGGRHHAVAVDASGGHLRLGPDGDPLPLTEGELRAAAAQLRTDAEPRSMAWMVEPDAYHYPHHEPVPLPVLRVVFDDPEATRYYLDPFDGALLRKVDRGARLYRWLHHGLHRFDFTAATRARPGWYVGVALLLVLSLLATGTGLWLGLRHLRRG